ncbi:hypothetical protein [Streptomyces sp. NPDC048669]|uniref:hypothetical protein n=1 Tax=Streptomyces sp. NPDC048669 TaxID=3155267 RepID=UPI00343DA580
MDQTQRRARIINMRKGRPLRRDRTEGPASTDPCPATAPHDDGGLYVCDLTTHDGMHLDEERSCYWLPDTPTT